MCAQDMHFAELTDGTLANQEARGEGQNNVMGPKMNLTHLYRSNCLFPERYSQEMTQWDRKAGGGVFRTHSFLFKRGT